MHLPRFPQLVIFTLHLALSTPRAIMNLNSTAQTRKSNSLAFARTDCHTCTADGVQCDRQRPQCNTCLNRGRKCGGFATPLSWDERRTYQGRSGEQGSCVRLDHRPAEEGIGGLRPPKRPFRFVLGGKRERKRRRVEQLPVVPDDADMHVLDSGRPESSAEEEFSEETRLESMDAVTALDTPGRLFDFSTFAPGTGDPGLSVSQQDYIQSLLQAETSVTDLNGMTIMDCPGATTGSVLGDIYEDGLQLLNGDNASVDTVVSTFRAPIGDPTVGTLETASVDSQNDALFQLCKKPYRYGLSKSNMALDDTEFCILPLTSDTALNPFRYRKPLLQGSRLLFHSILALCCRHLRQITGAWLSEEREHRTQAMKLLEYTLRNDQVTSNGLTLLDPILVLFTLDVCSMIMLISFRQLITAGADYSVLSLPPDNGPHISLAFSQSWNLLVVYLL